MARESFSDQSKRTLDILRRLKTAYPDAHCELNYSNPLQLLVATILSAQCTDKRVNLVTQSLFQKYRDGAGFCASAGGRAGSGHQEHRLLPQQSQEHPGGCRALVEEHGGETKVGRTFRTK